MIYYPLIDMDDEGLEKNSLFPHWDKSIVKISHHLYLEEDFLHNFRLYTDEPYSTKDYRAYKVHCPHCGKIMDLIAATKNGDRLGLYSCPNCADEPSSNWA